jgi:hypothetical protein
MNAADNVDSPRFDIHFRLAFNTAVDLEARTMWQRDEVLRKSLPTLRLLAGRQYQPDAEVMR